HLGSTGVQTMATLGSAGVPLESAVATAASVSPAATRTARHSLLVRVMHWIITLCFFALLITGSEILISHPRFYWGQTGHDLTPTLFRIPIPPRDVWFRPATDTHSRPKRLEPRSSLSGGLGCRP